MTTGLEIARRDEVTDRTLVDYRPSAAPAMVWQQIWFRARRENWQSLAIVPADEIASAHVAAEALLRAGATYEGEQLQVLDATGIELGEARDLADLVSTVPGDLRNVVVVLDCPMKNAASIPLARSADAVILLVSLGVTTFERAKKVIELVGREHFIGTVALRTGDYVIDNGGKS